jgi:hypothetical protein
MRRLISTSKGRIGGILACSLVLGLLGGVASAAPGIHADAPSTTSPSNEGSELPEAPEEDGDDQGGAQAAAHSVADCSAELDDIQATLPPADEATGLAHAIQVVEANCEKNLQAPGLVIALGHLATNFERRAAREADRAAGVHGNSADHGPSATHGLSGQHGPSDGQG